MNTPPVQILFDGTVANGVTQYVGVPIKNGKLGCHIAWLDATSSATITLETTSYNAQDAPTTTAGTYQWYPTAVSITGPAASAAGSFALNVADIYQRRARLKIVAAANSDFEIINGTHDV